MDDHYITLEIDYHGQGRVQFELPANATDVIAYFQTMAPRVEQELLEMVDPETLEVAFICQPELVS